MDLRKSHMFLTICYFPDQILKTFFYLLKFVDAAAWVALGRSVYFNMKVTEIEDFQSDIYNANHAK